MTDYNTDIEQILGRRITTLKDLKDAIKEYKDVLSYADEGTKEWTEATKNLNAAQERLDQITRAAKGTLDQYDKSEKDSINTLKQKIKQLNLERNAMDMNSKEYKKATKELKVLNDKLREAGTSAGDWRANVGNYANSIKTAFGELGTAAGGLTGPLGAVNASMLKLAANPVGAVILALVAALKLLAEGIKSSEENTNKFNEVITPLKGMLSVITQDIQSLTSKVLDFGNRLKENETAAKIFKGALQVIMTIVELTKNKVENAINSAKESWEFIKSIGENIGKKLQPVFDVIGKISGEIFKKIKPAIDFIVNAWNKLADTKLGKALGFDKIKEIGEAWTTAGEKVGEFTTKVEKATKTLEEVNKREAALMKRKREMMVENATIEGEVAALTLRIAEEQNKAVKDYDTILALMDEKAEKEKQIAANEEAIAQAEYDIIKARNSLTDNATKDLDAEAQAEQRLIQAKNKRVQVEAAIEKEKRRVYNGKYAEEAKEETEAYKNAVTTLNTSLKELELQYKETMDTMGKAPEAPKGAEIDRESINAYYDSMAQMYDAEYQAYATMTDKKIEKLEEFIETQKALNQDTSAQEIQLAELRRLKEKKYNEMRDKTSENERQRTAEQKKNYTEIISAYGGMLDGMSELFEENTVAYKLTSTAKAIIDTYLAANAVMAEQQGGMAARLAAMAGVIAAGVANVASIWKVNPKGSNTTPSADVGAVVTPPTIIDSTPYTYTRTVQTEEEEEKLNRPIWVKVSDITAAQASVQVRENESTF